MPEITGCSTNWYCTGVLGIRLRSITLRFVFRNARVLCSRIGLRFQPINQFRDDLDTIVDFFCRFDRCDYFYQCQFLQLLARYLFSRSLPLARILLRE
jgi:hypothetical protein